MTPSSHQNFRVRGISLEYNTRATVRDLVKKTLNLEPDARLIVYSLAISPTDQNTRTATLSFFQIPACLASTHDNEWVFHLMDGEDLDFSKSIVFDTHFAGFTPFQPTSDDDCYVDVIAVCGLGGHALGSFKQKNGPFVWLRDALPLDIPNARILTYGYDSQLVTSTSFQNLADLGRALWLDLIGIRDQDTPRPVIFIGHSLGGLVIKETVLKLEENTLQSDKLHMHAISGFMFFGVPHLGLAVQCLLPLVKEYPNRALLESLGKNSDVLQRLQRDFSNIVGSRPVVAFYETEKSRTAVEVEGGKFEPNGPSEVLVEVASATCGSQHQHPISRNHSEMVMYSSSHDDFYRRVVSALQPLVSVSRRPIAVTNAENGVNKLLKDRKECLRSLAFTEQELRYAEIHYARDTCEWLLQEPQYQRWINESNGLLWVKGTPGAGKSSLMKFAVDTMDRRKGGELILSFFFHGQGKKPLQKTPLGMFRALLNSMLPSFPEYLMELTQRFQNKQERFGSYEQRHWSWPEKELEKFMSKILASKKTQVQPVVIFIDALDECGERHAKALLAYIETLMEDIKREGSLVKICFSSRHYPIIGFETMPTICVEQKNGQDIRLVIQDRLKSIQRFNNLQQIETELLSKAHGSFQWAILITDMICNGSMTGTRTNTLLEKIATIPDDLQDLYQAILRGSTQAEESQMVKLFQWVLFAKRALSAQQLREALAIDKNIAFTSLSELRGHKDWCESLSQLEVRVRHLSRGLIEFQSREWGQEAQFIHQSAADYVMDNFLRHATCKPASQSVIGAGHYAISRSCLRYLTMREVLECGGSLTRPWLSIRFPLLPYGVTFILQHINTVEEAGIPQTDLLELINWGCLKFLKDFAVIWKKMDPNALCAPQGWPFKGATRFHVLVGLGSASLLRTCLEKEVGELNVQDSHGNTPLLIALRSNREDLAVLLLNNSMVRRGEQQEANHIAQGNHPSKRSNCLLYINIGNNYGQTPLNLAVSRKAVKTLQSLISAGVDIDIEQYIGRRAVTGGNVAVAKLLFETGQVNMTRKVDNEGWSVFMYAVTKGDIAIVKLLLETGHVDMKQVDDDGWSSFMYAVTKGDKAIVKLLLETGQVDINQVDNDGRSAVMHAVIKGDIAIVRLLLETGHVDMEQVDHIGHTLLSLGLIRSIRRLLRLYI